MAVVHRSKMDAWLVAVLGIAMAMVVNALYEVLASGSPSGAWVLPLALAPGIALPLWILLGTRYTLEPGQLVVQSGPFKWRVPLSEITAITPTRSVMSSPALSLDRLRIDYGRYQSLMISPRDKQQFLRDIEAARSASLSSRE